MSPHVVAGLTFYKNMSINYVSQEGYDSLKEQIAHL